jgi:hypothetical protein
VPAFLEALHTLTGLIVTGKAPGRAMLCADRLTFLCQLDGGLRPSGVADIIHKLLSKAIIRHSSRSDDLSVDDSFESQLLLRCLKNLTSCVTYNFPFDTLVREGEASRLSPRARNLTFKNFLLGNRLSNQHRLAS